MEIAPGIHRIESDLGARFMCQYLFVGSERVLLLDTGVAATPREVLVPYCERLGVEPDAILVSHADVDHSGGCRALRARYAAAWLACHERDRRWIESNEAMLRENYMWHEVHGFDEPDADAQAEMLADLGGDVRVALGLSGGETIGLGDDWRVEVLHLPGHTPGSIGLWDPRSRAAVIIDAVLYDGIYDRAGTKLIPPRYYDLHGQRATIHRLAALEPELLLTAHYPVLERREAVQWLDESLAFTHALDAVVREGLEAGTSGLWELTQLADARLGPYPEFMTELGASVRAHVESVPATGLAAHPG
jgi:glyoxylase-like metal-dependent hydrolase (beta-lactamase superfamily II)